MNKDEILISLLDKNNLHYQYEPNSQYIDDGDCIFDAIFEAMEAYKDQELSLLTEKYNKLKGAFMRLQELYCHEVENNPRHIINEASFYSEWNELAGLKEQ